MKPACRGFSEALPKNLRACGANNALQTRRTPRRNCCTSVPRVRTTLTGWYERSLTSFGACGADEIEEAIELRHDHCPVPDECGPPTSAKFQYAPAPKGEARGTSSRDGDDRPRGLSFFAACGAEHRKVDGIATRRMPRLGMQSFVKRAGQRRDWQRRD